ncbi:hypothetical protein AXG93_215s1270 [Marchantia polymorpha subsp. ruderalis]|uniref:Uncharacterized protein n=1 Tax=Marchantia polymorpha subsp. ruderalis TaxID=1480154 RepID=A0A176W1C9_MARPO|nr:hypothetical protein AXG93_215s1270 [Marchantia polymorpha subsp. ruderalis]
MEGAGTSISQAAELAKREMDSADEESELPSAIQDLVQRLGGQGEPISRLPDLNRPQFLEFFPIRDFWTSLSTITGWRSQVRLRVLESIASCNTLETLGVSDIFFGFKRVDISRLTDSEWELVLRGFRYSTILREIHVNTPLIASSDAEVESFCSQLGRILNSSSVTVLTLRGCRLSARCWLNLASGLRGHSNSKLKSLELCVAWEYSSAVKHVADMINSAPLLETLTLGYCYNHMDDEALGILSQALIQSSSLKELSLEMVDWGTALLLKALAGHDRNRSIERLRLGRVGSDRLGDCLRELLISNPSLKEVELRFLRMYPGQWHQLGEVIRDNAVATTILVGFDFKDDNWYSIEAFARSASSDVKDSTVELEIQTTNEDEVMLSLTLLGRVLRREIKSLSILDACKQKIITLSILPMKGKTGETSVLKRLELCVRSKDLLKKGVWKDLLCSMQGNHLTHLDLSDSELDEEAFRDLMGLLRVNLALQEIDVSRTSWAWARDGKAAQIQEALRQNQKLFIYKAGLYPIQQGYLFEKLLDNRMCRCLEITKVWQVIAAMLSKDVGGHYVTKNTGWNWVFAAIVKEWQEGRAPNADGLCGNPESWTIELWAQVLGLCAGNPFHWACIFWGTNHRNVKDMFKGSMNFLSSFVINFYRGMGLHTEAKLRKFPLEMKIAGSDDEVVLGDNEVASEEYNIEPAPPSTKVDKSEEDIMKQPTKKRCKLQIS